MLRFSKTFLSDLEFWSFEFQDEDIKAVMLIVDPAEEKLKSEFSSIKRSFIPVHSVIRIDEVEKEGVCKILDIKMGDNVTKLTYPGAAPKPKPKS